MARTEKAIKNAVFGIVSYTVTVLLSFFSQKYFINFLGYEYLGLNSLLTTVISTLSIVELGIGTAITFSLYKPLAENNQEKIAILVRLYKKIYFIIGFVVLGIGLAVIPALPALTKHAFDLVTLLPIYLLFLATSLITYFFTYNHTLLNADQKTYITSFVTMLTKIITIALQIAVLVLTSNYILYLCVSLTLALISNISVSVLVKKKYPYIKTVKGTLNTAEKKEIKSNVVALVYHRVGNYLVTGTDNLIISGFLGVVILGYYSNYLLMVNSLTALITNLFIGITSGFGNLIASESKENVLTAFKRLRFINFFLYAIASVGIFVLANTLLKVWVGTESALGVDFLALLCINFFITGYSTALGNIRAAAGVFSPDKYLHIIIAVLNLIVSIILVNFIGIIGVLLGTTICLVIKECIVLPRIGAKYIYGGRPRDYYLRLVFEFILCALIVAVTYYVFSLIHLANPWLQFLVGFVICVLIPAGIISLLYHRTDEFKYTFALIKRIVGKMLKKKKGESKSNMKIEKTTVDGVLVLTPQVFGDNRGWFTETYSKATMTQAGLNYDFVQDNQSFSAQKGILRGLHFQNNPMAQAKLVRCTRGSILDVAVDIRKGSDNYLKYAAVELSEENKKQLLIPRGFAHGFVTLSDNVEVQYKADNVYDKALDRGIRYSDPSIGVDWSITDPILSQKDMTSPLLQDSDCNFTVKVLVTGAKGQLGIDMMKLLEKEGYECLGADVDDFDITDEKATLDFIKSYEPYVVVHCAAYTAVDKAESEAEKCRRINVEGSKNIARACKEVDAKMVYISTDYVYNGKGDKPFETTSKPAPVSVYGKTKYEGEKACAEILEKLFIVRTSWVFGVNGNNFVKTMLRLANEKESINVVNDQIGSPTYTVDLASFIFYILNTQRYGVYHASNEEYCSWYEFAKEIFALSGSSINVNAIATSEYKSAAKRPLNSRLSKKCLVDCGFGEMPSWKDALIRYMEEEKTR